MADPRTTRALRAAIIVRMIVVVVSIVVALVAAYDGSLGPRIPTIRLTVAVYGQR